MSVTRREAVRLGAASAATAAVAAGLVGGADRAAAAARSARTFGRDITDHGDVPGRAPADAAAYRLAFWRGLVGSRVGLADRSGSFLVLRVQDLTTSRAAARAGSRTESRAGAGAAPHDTLHAGVPQDTFHSAAPHTMPNVAPSPRRPARTGEAFAVRLRGTGSGVPSDRVLRLFHPAVGNFDMFITSADPVSHDYVAVVNHRLPVG